MCHESNEEIVPDTQNFTMADIRQSPSTQTSGSDDETAEITCPKCKHTLNVNKEVTQVEQTCPVCSTKLRFFLFPRLFREPSDAAAKQSTPSTSGDATCQFYPELMAELVCDECGCFMSKKASVNWGDRDLCLPCLHSLRELQQSADFQAKTNIYDNRALALVTWLAPVTLFTAPLALFILIRHRKAGTGFIPRSKARWWLALILSILWIILWITLLVIWISLIVREFTS